MKKGILVLFILLSLSAGIIGSIFTDVGDWYDNLEKPVFNPPSWVFGPVWTTLYILIGIAGYLVYKNKLALGLFISQLVLNSLWSILFFGMQNILFALIEIFVLWLVIVSCAVVFYKVDKRATYLFVPYILWVSFAMVLNYSLFMLN